MTTTLVSKTTRRLAVFAAVLAISMGASGCLDLACALCCSGVPSAGSVSIAPGVAHTRSEARAVFGHVVEDTAQRY